MKTKIPLRVFLIQKGSFQKISRNQKWLIGGKYN